MMGPDPLDPTAVYPDHWRSSGTDPHGWRRNRWASRRVRRTEPETREYTRIPGDHPSQREK